MFSVIEGFVLDESTGGNTVNSCKKTMQRRGCCSHTETVFARFVVRFLHVTFKPAFSWELMTDNHNLLKWHFMWLNDIQCSTFMSLSVSAFSPPAQLQYRVRIWESKNVYFSENGKKTPNHKVSVRGRRKRELVSNLPLLPEINPLLHLFMQQGGEGGGGVRITCCS